MINSLSSIEDWNHDITVYHYDEGIEAQFLHDGQVDQNIIRKFIDIVPELVIYLGPAEGKALPHIETFKEIQESVPIINFLCDAGDPPWHPILTKYRDDGVFACSVNIDGNEDWPRGENDLTLFGPIDPRPYKEQIIKDIPFGFAGGRGSPDRHFLSDHLRTHNGLKIMDRVEKLGTYDAYATFMKRCQVALNMSKAGSGQVFQLKNRVSEAGLAKCCLLEEKGSLANKYLEPGVDYIEFETVFDVEEILKRLDENCIAGYAERLHKKVVEKLNPRIFWSKVLQKVC